VCGEGDGLVRLAEEGVFGGLGVKGKEGCGGGRHV